MIYNRKCIYLYIYFYRRKIGIQEEVYLKKNIDASSYQEIIISLQQEVENYKLV